MSGLVSSRVSRLLSRLAGSLSFPARPPIEGAAAPHHVSRSGRESFLMRNWRVMCCAVAVVLAAGGLQAVVRAIAQENGLLESRESIYNNIFIFGNKENVSMTFFYNNTSTTESSM